MSKQNEIVKTEVGVFPHRERWGSLKYIHGEYVTMKDGTQWFHSYKGGAPVGPLPKDLRKD